MPTFDTSDFIILGFYIIVAALGWFCTKPKFTFYMAIVLGVATCALLFQLHIYIEMGGLLHTLPFAFVGWLISRWRQKQKLLKPAETVDGGGEDEKDKSPSPF